MRTALFKPEPCVLVIDDHEISRQHTAEALLSVTSRVRQATSGQEGISCALSLTPELIFTDIHLPDICGLALPDRIREGWPAGRRHPDFVILSGDKTELTQSRVKQCRISGILVKPVRSCEIRNMALRLLNRDQAVLDYSTAQPGQVPRPGLKQHFVRELKARLPQLDRFVFAHDWASATDLTHQLIASSAICREQKLEIQCRQLHLLLSGNAPARSIAHAYYGFLQAVEHMKIESRETER